MKNWIFVYVMCATRGHNPNNQASTIKIEELSPMNNRTTVCSCFKMNSQICKQPH